MKTLILILIVALLTGCQAWQNYTHIDNAGSPEHKPAGNPGAPMDLNSKNHPWLAIRNSIVKEPYNEETNNCSHKARKFAEASEAINRPCKLLSVHTDRGQHMLVLVEDPMINEAHIVDLTTGETVPCYATSFRIIAGTIKHHKLGSLDHIKKE